MFDPYHQWLAIPRGQRPPTYYQLLGVAPDESDPEVIKEAAIRQTSHVRTYQTSPHATACTALLNEIALARSMLLNPAKRKDYDARLGTPAPEKRDQPETAAPAPFPGPGADPAPAPPPGAFAFEAARDPRPQDLPLVAASPHTPRAATSPLPFALAYAALLALGGVLAFRVADSRPPAPRPQGAVDRGGPPGPRPTAKPREVPGAPSLPPLQGVDTP